MGRTHNQGFKPNDLLRATLSSNAKGTKHVLLEQIAFYATQFPLFGLATSDTGLVVVEITDATSQSPSVNYSPRMRCMAHDSGRNGNLCKLMRFMQSNADKHLNETSLS